MNDMTPPRPNDLDAFWMPYTTNRGFKATPRLLSRAEGMFYYSNDGREILDGTAGLWCVNAGPRAARDHRGDPEAGRGDGLRADLPDGPPDRLPGRRQGRRADPGRARPHLLHQLRVGGGRHRAEDRARLPQGARRGAARAAGRARARLPRRRLRRHVGRRDRRQPQAVRRHAAVRRPPAAHARPRAQRVQPRPARARRAPRRRAGEPGGAARRHHRRRDGGAAGRLDRRADPARRLPAAAARAVRQARHPADLRRGHHRVRPDRRVVRQPSASVSRPTC